MLLPEEIKEGNALIAKYAGAIVQEEDGHYDGRELYVHYSRESLFPVNKYILSFPLRKLLYHESYDWLVPIVKKIMYFDNIGHYKESEGWYAYYILECELSEADIERVWQDVVKFIKWYNSLKYNLWKTK